jgi:uroporphyrinogen-III synthase
MNEPKLKPTPNPKAKQRRENQPLHGWRILTTRAGKQSGGLAGPLRELGAEVIEIPTIEIRRPRSYKRLDDALHAIATYDWLILTSVNGVDPLFARLKKLRMSHDKLRHLKIAAIGPATRREIEERGLRVTVTPEQYIAESVVEALRGQVEGQRVLLVRAKVARDVLPIELRKAGAHVNVAEAYETRIPAQAKSRLRKLFARTEARPHVATFTSSSTANNLLALLGNGSARLLEDVHLASIGPVTSGTLRAAGFDPSIQAREYTMAGLVAAIVETIGRRAMVGSKNPGSK